MEKEIIACINDKNVKYLQSGQISKYTFPMDRKEAHKKKIPHLIVRFFIISISPNNNILYLVQRRGKNKKSYPEYFTDSASGHVTWTKTLDLNEIKQNAIRELKEEFGIPPTNIRKVKFFDLNTEKDNLTKEISYVFLGLVDYNVDLKPNPNELEIEGSQFYTREELERLLKNEKLIDYSKEIWREILDMDVISHFKQEFDKNSNKAERIALFIGRFQPLHHGHIYVLNKILNAYNIVKIGIGSSQLSHLPNDPFTSEERVKFLKAALKKRKIGNKRYNIYKIPDIFDVKNWVDHVVSIVGEFNIIFSNSDWVRELFQSEGFRVAKKITIFKKKFNGNNIRSLIREENNSWRNLVPNEVIELMKDFNGIKRIKKLDEKSESS